MNLQLAAPPAAMVSSRGTHEILEDELGVRPKGRRPVFRQKHDLIVSLFGDQIVWREAIEGLTRIAIEDPDDPVVYDQVTHAICIVEVANTITDVGAEFGLDVDVKHFQNPRD